MVKCILMYCKYNKTQRALSCVSKSFNQFINEIYPNEVFSNVILPNEILLKILNYAKDKKTRKTLPVVSTNFNVMCKMPFKNIW